MTADLCAADGCGKPRRARGLCNAHYLRAKRKGFTDRLMSGPERNSPESVFKRAVPEGECLVWTGSKIPLGYGYISIGGKMRRVHAIAWESANGPIPEGMFIDHICHNRACVKVDHLRLATRAQNNSHLRGARRDSGTGVRNVQPNGSKFRVEIQKEGIRHYFGSFETVEDAALVAAQKRQELFGEFAGKG